MGFGPEFATKPAVVKASFDQVVAGLDLPAGVAERLFPPFMDLNTAGATHRQMALAITEVMASVVWRWPLLEAMATEFIDQDIWPLRWTELGIIRPLDWNAVQSGPACELLTFTLWRTASQVRRNDGQRLIDLLGSKVAYHITIGNKNCMVERLMAQRYGAKILAGDYTVMPPFFPGDGCSANLWPSR